MRWSRRWSRKAWKRLRDAAARTGQRVQDTERWEGERRLRFVLGRDKDRWNPLQKKHCFFAGAPFVLRDRHNQKKKQTMVRMITSSVRTWVENNTDIFFLFFFKSQKTENTWWVLSKQAHQGWKSSSNKPWRRDVPRNDENTRTAPEKSACCKWSLGCVNVASQAGFFCFVLFFLRMLL